MAIKIRGGEGEQFQKRQLCNCRNNLLVKVNQPRKKYILA
jgi:hypothetical protein